MNKFEIIDEYGYKIPEVLNKVLKKALKEEKVKKGVFTIILIDEAKIKELNKEYRNIDKVTDVLSFAYEDNEKEVLPYRLLGEIFICIPRMKSQANEYGHSEERELCFLALHGLLHLLGYNHEIKEEEEIMFGKQELVLNEFKETQKI